jgi:hypothetical protein
MIVTNDFLRRRAAASQASRYTFGTPAPLPRSMRSVRTLTVGGSRLPAVQLEGTNYYALEGLDSIFSKIGKALGKVAKGAFKVALTVGKIALPVAGGALALKVAAPLVSKGFSAIFHKNPTVSIAPNPGISLPTFGAQPPTTQVALAPGMAPSQDPSGAYSPVYQPAASGGPTVPYANQDQESSAAAPPAMPGWVVPVALGAAAVFAVTAMRPGRRAS